MNGFGMPTYFNTAGMPSLTPSPIVQTPVYTGGGSTPYATDQPALIPQPVVTPMPTPVFDWEAPLSFDGLNFADEPMTLVPTVTPPLSDKFGGYAEQPVVYAPGTSYDIPAKQPSSGPIEWILDTAGNIVKTAADTIWDTGKFILDHLEVGIGYAGDLSSSKTQKAYYEDLGDAAKTKAQAYADQVAAGTMTAEQAIAQGVGLGIDTLSDVLGRQEAQEAQEAQAAQPVFYQTPAAEGGSPNMMLYIGIAVIAYFLLR